MRFFSAFVLIAVAVAAVAARQSAPEKPVAGSAACRQCHARTYDRWSDSIHGKMIQEATRGAVLAAPVGNAGESGSKFWRNDRFYVVDEEGRERPVEYTLGNRRIQHYLTKEANGAIVLLRNTWDVRRKEWFHSSEIVPGAPRDLVQQWNMSCFFCHVTQQHQDRKGYDPETRSYRTEWVESSATCERCHGPMALHVSGSMTGAGWKRQETQLDKLMICGQCHWPKTVIATGFTTRESYLDHYIPALIHTEYDPPGDPSGWADARPKRFSTEARGFYLSGCFQSGQATCMNCHDPHWNRTDGNEELLRRPDQYCVKCHSGLAEPDHTRHAENSSGSSCVGCHMPRTVDGVRDRMRDHSMIAPVPENTVDYGIPNACNECHTDQSPRWAADKVAEWYPGRNAQPRLRALAFSMAKRGDAKSIAPLLKLVSDMRENPIVRASAAGYLGSFPGPLSQGALPRLAGDKDPLVRIETARSLGKVEGPAAVDALARLLTDRYRAVRVQAAAALIRIAFSKGTAVLQSGDASFPAFQKALGEYRDSLNVDNDVPNVLLELGFLELFEGRWHDASTAFQRVLAVEKRADAHYGLAMSKLGEDDRTAALEHARQALRLSGNDAHRELVRRLELFR